MFTKKINLQNICLESWNPLQVEESLDSIVKSICIALKLKEVSLYRLLDIQFSLCSTFSAIDEKSSVDENLFSDSNVYRDGMMTISSNKLSYEKKYDEVFCEINPIGFSFVSFPLKVNGQNIGLLFLYLNEKKQERFVLDSVIELETILPKVFFSTYKINKLEKDIVQLSRENSVKESSFSSTMSQSSLLEIVLSQSAQTLGYESAFLIKGDGNALSLESFSGNSFGFKIQDEIQGKLINLVMIESNALIEPLDKNSLSKFGVESILGIPLFDQPGYFLLLVSGKVRQGLMDFQVDIFHAYAKQLEQILKRDNQFQNFEKAYIETLDSICSCLELSRVELKSHHKRVEELALLIAGNLQVSVREKKILSLAARFHDVGLLTSLENTLDVGVEFQHPELSKSLVEPLSNGEEVGKVILEHHETYDGFGFPFSKRGEEISLLGQILACAEAVIERMTPSSISPESSAKEAAGFVLSESGRKFSPRISESCAHVLEKLENSSEIIFQKGNKNF